MSESYRRHLRCINNADTIRMYEEDYGVSCNRNAPLPIASGLREICGEAHIMRPRAKHIGDAQESHLVLAKDRPMKRGKQLCVSTA